MSREMYEEQPRPSLANRPGGTAATHLRALTETLPHCATSGAGGRHEQSESTDAPFASWEAWCVLAAFSHVAVLWQKLTRVATDCLSLDLGWLLMVLRAYLVHDSIMILFLGCMMVCYRHLVVLIRFAR